MLHIDLKKAFDNVNRDDLWYKLEQLFGLNGKFIKVLKGMYAEVFSCVQVNDRNVEAVGGSLLMFTFTFSRPCVAILLYPANSEPSIFRGWESSPNLCIAR